MTVPTNRSQESLKVSRPLIPSRATYWIWFGLASIMVFGMLAYLLWAHARGLLSRSELLIVDSKFLIAGAASTLLGVFFRYQWKKKCAALRAYEEMLTSIR